MARKQIIILTGPSGAGKTDMRDYLLENYSYDFCKFITSTTRPIRRDEKHGEDYYFRLLKDFPKMVQNKEFFEYEEVFPGGFYGCEYFELDRILNSKKTPIIVADVKGALKFLGLAKGGENMIDLTVIEPIVFYIDCPMEELIKRIKEDNLSGKRNDKEEDMEARFKRMVFEIEQKSNFENILYNFGRHQDMSGNELVNSIFKQLKNERHGIF